MGGALHLDQRCKQICLFTEISVKAWNLFSAVVWLMLQLVICIKVCASIILSVCILFLSEKMVQTQCGPDQASFVDHPAVYEHF